MYEDKLILVDGHSIAHSGYHATLRNGFTNKDGRPTGATYVFIQIINNLLDTFPSHFSVVFDALPAEDNQSLDASTYSNRKELSSTYKGNRKPMDEALKIQLGDIQTFLRISNIPFISKGGIEADDIIATLVAKFHKDIPVVVYTRDTDMIPLVEYDNTTIMLISTGRTRELNKRNVKEIMGLTGEQLFYQKVLTGDNSDNVRGIPGIGKVTAQKLLEQYEDLDTIVAKAKEGVLTPLRIGALIKDNIKTIESAYNLIRLQVMETTTELDSLKLSGYDVNELNQFLDYLDIKHM